jgi:hypothetical protein
MSVAVKARSKRRAAQAVAVPQPVPPAAPKAKGIRRLPSAERIRELIRRLEEGAEARGMPSDLAAWIEGRVRSALSKAPGQLSEDEKRALIAFRYLASPSGMGADVRRESKRIARLVSAWLKQGRSDIPGIDEPGARALFAAIRGAVKRRDWGRLRSILEGGPIRRVGRRKKAAPPPPAAPAVAPAPPPAQPAPTPPAPAPAVEVAQPPVAPAPAEAAAPKKRKGGRRGKAEAAPAQPAPEEVPPPEAVAELVKTLGPVGGGAITV